MKLKAISEFTEATEQELYEMANLPFSRTGLPFVVWISPRGNARHDARVKVSNGPNYDASKMASVAIRPTVQVVEGEMRPGDLKLLPRWIELNRDVLVRFWDGDIEYTEHALAALRSIKT